MKSDGSLGIGMVAEEVEALDISELVIHNSAGEPDGIQWDRVTSYMLNVPKDEQKEIDALNLVLGPDGTFSNASSTLAMASNSGFADWVVNTLRSLGMALKDGVATLQGLVVDTLTAKHVNTDQICVKDSGNNDICLTGDQLKDLINKAGSSVTVNQTFTVPAAPPVDTPLTVETGAATTTAEIAQPGE